MTEKLTMKSDYMFCEFFSRKGKVTLDNEVVIDVEMQVKKDPNWEKRVTY